MDLRTDREQLFGLLARPETTSAFFERVAEDVDWTVEGTHPLAGRYTSKQVFVESTFGRLGRLMRDGTHLEGCRFDAAEPGATIVEVRAYLDSAMVAWTVQRNEQIAG